MLHRLRVEKFNDELCQEYRRPVLCHAVVIQVSYELHMERLKDVLRGA